MSRPRSTPGRTLWAKESSFGLRVVGRGQPAQDQFSVDPGRIGMDDRNRGQADQSIRDRFHRGRGESDRDPDSAWWLGPGRLQIPSIPVQSRDDRDEAGISHVEILPVPAEGRPAAFLGGVGRFPLHAEVSAKVVRVGQEFEFRVKVSGPAAWGMSELPELTRYDRLPLGLRIRAGPTETQGRAARAHLYVSHLRPSRAGEGVLPPISIASFESVYCHAT